MASTGEHHDDFVHVPHDDVQGFDKDRQAGTVKTSIDIPMPPARNAPGSVEQAAGQAHGEVPQWLKDEPQQGSNLSSGLEEEPYPPKWQDVVQEVFPSQASHVTQSIPVQDVSKDLFTPQLKDLSKQSLIREVPRSEPETAPERSLTPMRTGAVAESRMSPPPSRINEQQGKMQGEGIFSGGEQQLSSEKAKEQCPLPVPNVQTVVDKYLPQKVRYILYYNDPVYSVLVLGSAALFLKIFTSNLGFALWSIAFTLKWTLLSALALTAGSFFFKRYVNKEQNPPNYIQANFQPRINRWASKLAYLAPPQETVTSNLNWLVNGLYSLPRRFFNALYSQSWMPMVRGVIVLQILQTMLSLFSPRTLMWIAFALVCTVPKIYQLYRKPIDNFINFVHGKLAGIWNAFNKVPAALSTGHPTSQGAPLSTSTVSNVPATTTVTSPNATTTTVPLPAGVGGAPGTTVTTVTITAPAEKKVQ